MGCGLASFTTNNKPDDGKCRLYRILISETAYLIWKIRNEKRIRDSDGGERVDIERETKTRWKNTLNKRLTNNRFLTNSTWFGKRALNEGLIKRMWTGCLDNEEVLPHD